MKKTIMILFRILRGLATTLGVMTLIGAARLLVQTKSPKATWNLIVYGGNTMQDAI